MLILGPAGASIALGHPIANLPLICLLLACT
jgi:hypothetical protein